MSVAVPTVLSLPLDVEGARRLVRQEHQLLRGLLRELELLSNRVEAQLPGAAAELCARALELLAHAEAGRDLERLLVRSTFRESEVQAAFSIALDHEAQREAAEAMFRKLSAQPLDAMLVVRDCRRYVRQVEADLDVVAAKLEGGWLQLQAT